MKFIRCYIENFGKLQQFKIQFKDNITIINKPNGFGKTTLTAFIKAMLYGLPKNNLPIEKNDRKRYFPWQGGIYGGYLEFEHNNIVYRIERTFGQTPKEDRFKLFRLNPFGPSTDYSENIGFELLGVTSENFDRTTYVPQIRWNTTSSSKEVKDQISNIVETTLDIGSYEKAIKTLKSQRSEILPYRGKSGLLYKLSSELSETEQRLRHCASRKTQLQDKKERLKEYEYEIQKKKSTLENSRKEIYLQSNSPSQTLISDQYYLLNAQMQTVQKELDAIDLQFPLGLPSDEELQICIEHMNQSTAADNFFDNSLDFPEQEMIDEYELKLNELEELKRHVDYAQDEISNTKPNIIFPILYFFITFSLFSIAFVLVQYTFPLEWSVALWILSICSLAASIVSISRYATKRNTSKSLERKITLYNQKIIFLEQDLREEMAFYDLRETDLSKSLAILKKRTQQYQTFHYTKKNTLLVVRKILNKYHLYNFPETPEVIGFLAEKKNKRRNLLIQEKTIQSQIETLNQYCFEDRNQNDNHLKDSPKELELVSQIDLLQNEVIVLHKEIALLQLEADQFMELEDSLHSLVTQRTAAEKQVEQIDKAIIHLQSAFESLSKTLITPLKERFAENVSLFLQIPLEKIFINDDISVSVEFSGVHRDQTYLSIGELDIIALCMRLAILDILYPEHKPPLILDDPFVNLDAINMRKVLDVLNKISKSHQIIYLTCHESRI